jgi:hypothetical protein
MAFSTALPKTRDYAGDMQDQQMADQMASLGAGIPALLRQQRTLNMRQNPGLKKAQAPGMIEQAIPGALTSAGIPDSVEGADNKQFWEGNAELAALTEPGSGSFRASTGVRPSPMGGANMARPVDSLQGMSSFGNVNAGPSSMQRDVDSQKLRGMQIGGDAAQHAQREAERTPEQEASDAAVLAKSAGETKRGLDTEAEIAKAKNYFQRDVYRAEEAKAGAATQQLYERYGRPAETRAAADLHGKELGAGAEIDVANIRAQNASYVAKINALQRTASTMALDDPQRKNIEGIMKYLQDEINKSQVDAPQVPPGLGVR